MTTTSHLDALIDDWKARGWNPDDLHLFRMEQGGDDDSSSGDGSDAGGDGAGDGAGSGDGTSDGGGDGSGDAGNGDANDGGTDWKAEAEKWKGLARKHEDRAKSNADKAKKFDESSLTDAEKVAAEAEERGRKAALAEHGQKLAGAEIKAALAGVVPDPKAIVEDLNLAKYVTDDGEVDEDAVKALREKYLALAKPGKPSGSADGGSRGDDKSKRAGSIQEAVTKRLTNA
jgi:hypothetical protein